MRAAVRSAAIGGMWMLMFAPGGVAGSGPEAAYRHVITSAKANQHEGSFLVSQRDLSGIKTGPWSVRTTVLHGGKQEGVELIAIDNGKLSITLIPTRGMSIL